MFDVGSIEYLFHEVVEAHKLLELLAKFPGAEQIFAFVDQHVLHFEPLAGGFERDLLSEVNALIELLPAGTVEPATSVETGEINLMTDEMFCLNAELNYAFQDHAKTLSSDDRAFLREFFYGIDFTHWTKWAVLMNYTDLNISLPTILRARRNDVKFSLDGRVVTVATN